MRSAYEKRRLEVPCAQNTTDTTDELLEHPTSDTIIPLTSMDGHTSFFAPQLPSDQAWPRTISSVASGLSLWLLILKETQDRPDTTGSHTVRRITDIDGIFLGAQFLSELALRGQFELRGDSVVRLGEDLDACASEVMAGHQIAHRAATERDSCRTTRGDDFQRVHD